MGALLQDIKTQIPKVPGTELELSAAMQFSRWPLCLFVWQPRIYRNDPWWLWTAQLSAFKEVTGSSGLVRPCPSANHPMRPIPIDWTSSILKLHRLAGGFLALIFTPHYCTPRPVPEAYSAGEKLFNFHSDLCQHCLVAISLLSIYPPRNHCSAPFPALCGPPSAGKAGEKEEIMGSTGAIKSVVVVRCSGGTSPARTHTWNAGGRWGRGRGMSEGKELSVVRGWGHLMLGLQPSVPAKELRTLQMSAVQRRNKTKMVRRRIATIFHEALELDLKHGNMFISCQLFGLRSDTPHPLCPHRWKNRVIIASHLSPGYWEGQCL